MFYRYGKTCPRYDIWAIVLDGSAHSFQKPPHIAFYTVMQTSRQQTRVMLYVVYRGGVTPTMDVTNGVVNNDTVEMFKYIASRRVQSELRKPDLPIAWRTIFTQAAEELKQNRFGIP